MYVLVTYKNKEDLIQNEGARVFIRFPPLRSTGNLTPQPFVRSASILNSVQTLRLSSLLERMKKIQSKMKARVFITLYINFSDMQGQITLELVVVSGRYLNSLKLLRMSVLPARMRMIEQKIKALECSQDFIFLFHYKSMGIFPDAQGQQTTQSLVRSDRISNSSEML